MFKHILIPTDFSPTSHAALRLGLELALAHGSELTLLHISEEFSATSLRTEDNMDIADDLIAFDEKRLGLALWERLRELTSDGTSQTSGALKVTKRIMTGAPAQRILEVADEVLADAILMGTHGRHKLLDRLLGSTAERVLRGANCSVLVVKADGYPMTRA